jgi:hypothetical protein
MQSSSSSSSQKTIPEGPIIMSTFETNSLLSAMGSLPLGQRLSRGPPPVTLLSEEVAASLLGRLRSSSVIAPNNVPVPTPTVEPTRRSSAVCNRAKDPGVALSRAKAYARNLRFLILVRILLKDLERTGDHTLKNNLKRMVQECIRRRRNNEAGFRPLERSIETVIKATVGTARWKMAHDELEKMMMQREMAWSSS